MEVTIKQIKKKKKVFTPIYLYVEVRIDSQKELDDLKEEFVEGEFADFSTSYSVILYRYINKLKTFIFDNEL